VREPKARKQVKGSNEEKAKHLYWVVELVNKVIVCFFCFKNTFKKLKSFLFFFFKLILF
jgi:hypothetical protein